MFGTVFVTLRSENDMNQKYANGLDFIAKRGLGLLADSMGILISELSLDRAVARMPVQGNTQPIGLLHGGAYVVLGETLGSMMANYYAQTQRDPYSFAVGIEINASHTSSAKDGYVTAVCVPLHLGKTLTTHHIAIHNEKNKLCSTVRITNLIKYSTEHTADSAMITSQD